ncbi:hypothetical protein [Streptomyces shenzhenensis]|nr:hypothetical protein [Streptomyces shenzhenensis]
MAPVTFPSGDQAMLLTRHRDVLPAVGAGELRCEESMLTTPLREVPVTW